MSESRASHDTRSLLKNTAAGFMALIVTQLAALVSAACLGRWLGPELVGVYSYSFAVVSMALILVIGTDQPLIREVAKDRKAAGRLFVASLAFRAPVSIALYFVLLALLHFKILHFKDGLSADGRMLMYVAWLTILTESAFQAGRCVFVGLERQEIVSTIVAGLSIVRTGLTILIVYLGFRLFHMGLVALLTSAAAMCVSLFILTRHTSIDLRIDRTAIKTMLVVSGPFLLGDTLAGVITKFDHIYLPAVVSNKELGLYTSSYRLYVAVTTMGLAADNALFPIIMRRSQEGAESLRRAWDMMHKYLAVAAVASGIGIAMLAEPLMALIYGDKFAGAGAILRVLAWAAVIYFPMIPSYRILIAKNGQMRLVPLFLIRAAVNVGLNLLLAPILGGVGCAIAMVTMEVLHAVLCFTFAFRTVEMFPIVRWYVKPALAGAAMAGFIYLLRADYHVALVGPGALVVYGLALIALRTFTRVDVELVRGAVRSRSEH